MADLFATAVIKDVISAACSVKVKIFASANLKTLSPTGEVCTPYDLIDGGAPGTTYVPINGFNLISGGGA